MATVHTKIEPLDDWVRITVSGLLSPEARSLAVADFARGRIAEADQANRQVLGRVAPHKLFVDGREGAALEQVNPDHGTIAAEFDIITDLFLWIGKTLRDRSPVQSGRYRDSHTLFADGREVPIGATVPPADEYVFLNPVPYARKIEIGKTKSGRAFVLQVKNRIYERTANDAKRRFSKLAKIRFGYRAPIASRIFAYQPAARGGWRAAASRRGGVERAARVPAIVITVSK